MAKRVLGDDPFSDGASEEITPDAKAKSPASKRPSVPPKPRASSPPKAPRASAPAKAPRAPMPSKPARRSKAPPAEAEAQEVSAPPPPKVPVIDGLDEVIGSTPPIAAEAEAAPEVVITEGVEVVISTSAQGAETVESAAVPSAAEEVVTEERVTEKDVESAAQGASPAVPEEVVEASVVGADLPPEVTVDERAQSVTPSAQASTEDLERTIRELEARLDTLLEASREQTQPLIERVTDKLRAVSDAASARAEASPERDDAQVDVNRELLSSDYYLRRWGRVAMRDRAEEVDDFGYDPSYDARLRPVFDFLYERWWRVDVEGIDGVPTEGRVALVANHSGAVPYDGIMLAAAMRKEHPSSRQLRWLAEDFVSHLPFMGAWLTRLGAVRACQENAERLLRKESCIAMFPEGVKGIAKLYRDRYKLQRFGRGGHIKLAIRTRTPLVPVAIVGAEETHPMLGPSTFFARMLSVPYVPITPTFPALGLAGAIPLPSKWRILFGDPMPMDSYGPDAADDEVLVGRLNEKLRTTIQDMLDRALRQRRSVFRG